MGGRYGWVPPQPPQHTYLRPFGLLRQVLTDTYLPLSLDSFQKWQAVPNLVSRPSSQAVRLAWCGFDLKSATHHRMKASQLILQHNSVPVVGPTDAVCSAHDCRHGATEEPRLPSNSVTTAA